MLDKAYHFPVTEVGLGQMGVWRRGQLEFNQHGAVLRLAAKLLRPRLDPSAEIKPPRRRRSLRQNQNHDKLSP